MRCALTRWLLASAFPPRNPKFLAEFRRKLRWKLARPPALISRAPRTPGNPGIPAMSQGNDFANYASSVEERSAASEDVWFVAVSSDDIKQMSVDQLDEAF